MNLFINSIIYQRSFARIFGTFARQFIVDANVAVVAAAAAVVVVVQAIFIGVVFPPPPPSPSSRRQSYAKITIHVRT